MASKSLGAINRQILEIFKRDLAMVSQSLDRFVEDRTVHPRNIRQNWGAVRARRIGARGKGGGARSDLQVARWVVLNNLLPSPSFQIPSTVFQFQINVALHSFTPLRALRGTVAESCGSELGA